MSQRDENITFRSKPNKYTYTTIQEKKLDVGLLGKLFGSHENAPTNIAGFLLFILILAGVIVLILKPSISAVDFWSTIVPVITLLCGYLFGKKP